MYADGIERANTTDSTYTTGYIGVSVQSSDNSLTIDNLRVANLTASGNEILSGTYTTWFNASTDNETYKIIIVVCIRYIWKCQIYARIKTTHIYWRV